MNLTLALFLLGVLVCAVLAIRRPSWGIALYMLTYFLAPPFWWWGKSVAEYRWNLLASLVLLGSVLINVVLRDSKFISHRATKWLLLLATSTALNATAVHVLFAPNAQISSVGYVLTLKMLLLLILMAVSIRDETDLKIIVLAIVLGAGYIGYEVTINDRGSVRGGRLEGVGTASASTANDLACLMVSSTMLVGPLFLFGTRYQKLVAIVVGPLVFNVILLCNSRGALLGLLVSGVAYVLAAPRSMRVQVYKIAGLGAIVGFLLLGDPRIVERFMTTFNTGEQRDHSATSRTQYWKAGLMLLADQPLGSGGQAFKKVYGARYIERVTGVSEGRSVHQGYIDEACEWGLQGLLLRLLLFGTGLVLAWHASRRAMYTGQWYVGAVALSVLAGLIALMIQALFGTFLTSEWGVWMIALALGCHRLVEAELDDAAEYCADDESEANDPEIFDGPLLSTV